MGLLFIIIITSTLQPQRSPLTKDKSYRSGKNTIFFVLKASVYGKNWNVSAENNLQFSIKRAPGSQLSSPISSSALGIAAARANQTALLELHRVLLTAFRADGTLRLRAVLDELLQRTHHTVLP